MFSVRVCFPCVVRIAREGVGYGVKSVSINSRPRLPYLS